jgi:endonuclease G
MPRPALRFAISLLALLLAAAPLEAQEANRNVRFGLPSAAQADPRQRDDYLIERPQYVLSYHAEKRTPNWVCWQLRAQDIGSAARGPFAPDPLLPKGFARVTSHVYDGSGFDRGHQCPAKDRSATQKDCDATFYLTNVVPQSPASNQKAWERLESYCRELAKRGHVLQIACGPLGVGGTGKDGYQEEIGKGRLKVTVPARLWKVILVLPNADAEPRKNTRVSTVLMPNDQTVGYDWTRYRVSARRVEHQDRRRIPAGRRRNMARGTVACPDKVAWRGDGGDGAVGCGGAYNQATRDVLAPSGITQWLRRKRPPFLASPAPSWRSSNPWPSRATTPTATSFFGPANRTSICTSSNPAGWRSATPQTATV